MTIDRLERTTMAESAIRSIREAILNGTLKQGSRLREAALAETLGISRAPLREALHRLEEEGLVVRAPFRGTVVAEVSDQTAAEIWTLRSVLEPFAVECGRDHLATAAGRAELVDAVARLELCARENDHAGAIDAHLAVHRTFYRAAKNEILLSLWQSWEQSLRLYLVAQHEAYPSLTGLGRAHRRLLAAIQSGDPRKIADQFSVHFGPTRPIHYAESEADAPAGD